MAIARSKKRNRTEGHDWEREVVKDLREHGYPLAVTARSANRRRDAEKIDVVNKDEYDNGRMFDDIQAKNTSSIPWQLLLELEQNDKGSPKRRKVLAVKMTEMITNKVGKRQKITKAKLATMFWRDYLELLAICKRAQQLVNLYGEDHEVWKKPVFSNLKQELDALSRKGHG